MLLQDSARGVTLASRLYFLYRTQLVNIRLCSFPCLESILVTRLLHGATRRHLVGFVKAVSYIDAARLIIGGICAFYSHSGSASSVFIAQVEFI